MFDRSNTVFLVLVLVLLGCGGDPTPSTRLEVIGWDDTAGRKVCRQVVYGAPVGEPFFCPER